MIERASVELGLIPARSYVVGDQTTDIELANRIGATALLIRGEQATAKEMTGVPIVADLWHAALWIVEHKSRPQKVGA